MTDRAIGAAQTVPARGDVDANVAAHLRLARVAAGEGARLLVFPEMSLTGYEMDLAERLAFSREDPRLSPLVKAASSLRLTLVVGAPVRIGARLHVGAFILGPDGAVGLYTKQHLGAFPDEARVDGVVPPAESVYFHPGELDPLIRIGNHTAAVAVCADTGRPSHPLRASRRGADTYLASVFVIRSDLEGESERLRSYARRHSMAVVMANYGGPTGGLASGGCSAIWSPLGALLARLPATGVGVAVAIEGEEGWRAAAVPARP